MRNLKRVLSLVLATMMLLGMMVIGASAADAGSTSTTLTSEEVQVLNALGVIQGDTHGNLKLGDTIKRSEYATILYRITTGDVEGKSDALAEAAKENIFPDVASNAWYAGYVNYSAQHKLLKGRTNGNYDPNAEVNGYEVLVTLLRALGYDAVNEYENSTHWEQDVALQAYRLGIIDDTDGLGNYATRELIAKIIFTGITEPGMVTYKADSGEYVGDTANGNKVTLGEFYFKLQEADATAPEYAEYMEEDGFKRPAPDKIYTAKTTEDPILVRSTPVTTYGSGTFTGADAAALLKIAGETPVNVIYNGGNVNDVKIFPKINGGKDLQDLYLDKTTGIKGYEIEVYTIMNEPADDTTPATVKEYRVIVREAYLAKVDEIKNEGDSAKVTIYEAGKAAPVDITVEKYDDTKEPATGDKIYADVAAHADEYIAVYMNPNWVDKMKGDSIIAVAELTKLAKDTTDIARRDFNKIGKVLSSITLTTGEKYGFNNEAIVQNSSNTMLYLSSTIFDLTSGVQLGKSDVYLYNGYVLFIDQGKPITKGPDADAGYAYLYDIKLVDDDIDGRDDEWQSGTGMGSEEKSAYSIHARLLLANDNSGEMYIKDDVEVKLKSDEGIASTATRNEAETYYKDNMLPLLGHLVYYSANGGKYDLTDIALVPTVDGDKGPLQVTTKKSEAVVPATGKADGAKVAFDDQTVFIVVTDEPSKKAMTNEQLYEHVAIYDIYNVPSFDVKNAEVTTVLPLGEKNALPKADPSITSTSDPVDVAGVVLIKNAGDPTVVKPEGTYFIVVDPDAVQSKMYQNGESGDQEIQFYIFNAVIDGKLDTVMVKASEVLRVFDTNKNGKIDAEEATYLLTTDIEGQNITSIDGTYFIITKLGDELTDKDVRLEFTKVDEYKNAHIALTKKVADEDDKQEDYLCDEDTVAYVYSTKDGSIKLVDITGIKADNKYTGSDALRDRKTGVLEVLFLTEDTVE